MNNPIVIDDKTKIWFLENENSRLQADLDRLLAIMLNECEVNKVVERLLKTGLDPIYNDLFRMYKGKRIE